MKGQIMKQIRETTKYGKLKICSSRKAALLNKPINSQIVGNRDNRCG
jgi:hypothetical protein